MKIKLAISAIVVALTLPVTALAQQSTQQRADDCLPAASVKGAAQFLVTRTRSGYSILLPPGLLQQLPARATYKISLIDKQKEKATIAGSGVKKGDNFLNIRTKDRFKLKSIARDKLVAIDIAAAGPAASPRSGGCSGCPRDDGMKIYIDETICWCDAAKEA
jgi:hypothetical protein